MNRAWLLAAVAVAWPAAAGEPLRHFYFVGDAASWQSLSRNHEAVSLLSPVWFTVTGSGTVESSMDVKLVEWAAARNIPVMPVLVNKGFDAAAAHSLLTSDRAQETLVSSILKIAALRRFAGIQLDLENLAPDDRDRFTRFVERFARGLHNLDMKLSVAVMSPLGPQPHDGSWPRSPHAAAFDYFQIGNAADYVTLMAYDQHTSPDSPGPIAGLPWVEACLQKILEVVPSSKLLLGIPLYYRRWGGERVSEGPISEALALAQRWQAKIQQEPAQAESQFRFEAGDKQHVVWLNAAADLRRRVDLVKRYRLRGYSAWRLGQEDPAAWRSAFAPAASN